MKNEKETKNPAVNAGYAEKDISVNAEIARDNEAHHVFDELSKKFVAAKEGERTPAYRGGSFLLQREQHH